MLVPASASFTWTHRSAPRTAPCAMRMPPCTKIKGAANSVRSVASRVNRPSTLPELTCFQAGIPKVSVKETDVSSTHPELYGPVMYLIKPAELILLSLTLAYCLATYVWF